jgi:hypothetical protein
MAQDFSDLGIDIQDFLDDLIKIRHSENSAFDTYNSYIQTSNTQSSPQKQTDTNTPATFSTRATSAPPFNNDSSISSPTNLMKKFVDVEGTTSTPSSLLLDKPIILKNNETRRHVHRYDLRIGIKECRSEEEEQKLLQGLLEEFFDTMLSADKTIVIPPYYDLDRSNSTFDDISATLKISDIESFTRLKRYFSRLGNRNPATGYIYCSCIIAASTPHSAIMTQVSQILQESKMSLWPRSSDHENVGRIGWLLYSLQDMDALRLKSILTTLTGCEIGVKWMKVNTEYGSKKNMNNNGEEPTKAFVLEGPQDKVYELRDILSYWYGSKSTSFPDAVRMRLIPPLDALSDANRQQNYGAALAKQASFVSKIGKGSSWEFSSNLILDKKEPTTGISLRQIIMSIPSSQHKNYPLFHCVNRGWKEGSTVVFHFLPCHESEARMYISGIIAYLRATSLPWYQELFKPIARSRSQGTTWDPSTRQLHSLVDSNFADTLQQDPLYDLTNSDAGLLSAFHNEENRVQFDIPVNDGSSLGFFKDTDSITTFRSTVKSVLKKKKSPSATPSTIPSTPTQSISFCLGSQLKPDDTSVSRMSDTASKVAGLETKFQQLKSQFASSFLRLETIISNLGNQSLAANVCSTGSNQTLVPTSANLPASVSASGSTQNRAAGPG